MIPTFVVYAPFPSDSILAYASTTPKQAVYAMAQATSQSSISRQTSLDNGKGSVVRKAKEIGARALTENHGRIVFI
jgi:hypothetical protein